MGGAEMHTRDQLTQVAEKKASLVREVMRPARLVPRAPRESLASGPELARWLLSCLAGGARGPGDEGEDTCSETSVSRDERERVEKRQCIGEAEPARFGASSYRARIA